MLDAIALAAKVLDRFLDLLRQRYDEQVRASDSLRWAYYVVDLMVAIVRGAIEDGLVEADGFDSVDDVDFRDWLLAHGAMRESVDCALVRSVVYDLAFGFEGGDPQRPSCGAGTALRGLLRTFFTYRGALMWKMNAGMGDVVFAPLYELLVKRGVEVRFFHRVEAVRAANGLVEEIEIDVQADVPAATDPREYLRPSPAASASSGPALWPADPAHLLAAAEGSAVSLPPEAYESWYADRDQARVATKVLKRGAATDGFGDAAVARPSRTRPGRRAGGGGGRRLRRALRHLGRHVPSGPAGAGCGRRDRGVLLQRVDRRPATGPRPGPAVARRPDGSGARARAAVPEPRRRNALAEGGRPAHGGIRLGAPDRPRGTVGEDRLEHQYLRANVEPSERYVLSVPGSSAYRIAPDDTGFSNLYAVGDWTACTLNAGCVEAAVISGMVAANAIHQALGDPANMEAIIGHDGR